MERKELIKRLETRRETCIHMMMTINNAEVKAQYYGEVVGLEYAIGLLSLEK